LDFLAMTQVIGIYSAWQITPGEEMEVLSKRRIILLTIALNYQEQ